MGNKEVEEINRRVYKSKTLEGLKKIGKKKGLLNVDQYKKADKNVLIERLIKGKQLSDESKDVLLEQAKNTGLKVNATMNKKDILEKLTNPKLTDFNEKRLRELAKKGGIPLRSQMTNKAIIQRLENPTKFFTVESLKRLARDNNIDVKRNIKKTDLINILEEKNLIKTTSIKASESKLGVSAKNIPEELKKVVKKKARNPIEELEHFKEYIKNLKEVYITPSRLNKLSKQLKKKEDKAEEFKEKIFIVKKETSAFKNFTVQYKINGEPSFTPDDFLLNAKPAMTYIMDLNRNIKVKLYLNCYFKRIIINVKDTNATNNNVVYNIEKPFAFHSIGNKLILENTDVYELYDEMSLEILEEIAKVSQAVGSGWVFLRVESLVLHTVKWDPINAGSYIELPNHLKSKKAIINMKNVDDKCFMWCVLRALNPKTVHPERRDNDLKSKQDKINMKGIRYPVSFRDIDRFESQNTEISITVLGYNKDERVYPLKISKYTGSKHDIVLLLIKDGEKSHYCIVNNLSALMASQINNHKGTRNFCLNCFNSFNTKDSLNKHKEYCYNNDCIKLEMPKPGTYLSFKNYPFTEKAPFVIYADFECLIKPIDNCEPNPKISYTNKIHKHKPVSFCYYILCSIDGVYKPVLRKYMQTKEENADAMDTFIKWLEEDVKAIANIEEKKMFLTEEDIKQFDNATDCWICRDKLNNDKVRDHCHYTGRYRGAAHRDCNLNYRKPKSISVFFHNLSGYDSHLFIKKLGSPDNKEKIDCIPNNEERYISFSKTIKTGQYTNKKGETKDKTFKIVFKDSLKFMAMSLEKLVNNLPKDAFINLNKYFTTEEAELLKQKGFFPYEYMDTAEKLNETKPPTKDVFYSKLTGKGISNNNYKHVLNIWGTFKMNKLLEYLELYNVTDVLLLADVFENFRDLCLKIYKLDPVHYFTAPGLAWDACLKLTNIDLELLSDTDMLLMFEKGIRGGISVISNRYGEANNKYMRKYDKNKPSKYLMYMDANNLYGCAMSMKLPTHGFKWLTVNEMENLFNVQVVEEWEKTPCILEVDLEYPENLHNLHNDYPFCAERIKCKGGVEKLIPNLQNKTKYIIHYRNLIQCLRAGMKLKKIHRGIKFIESDWMKPYIDKNTNLRAKANNSFEKDFYKLMNNSVFGKTMENIRNRVDVRLVNNEERASKLAAKPNLRSPPKIFSENLISIHLKKIRLTMNKPIYLGMCILDLSKTLMFDFHYNYIKAKYDNKAKLLFTDTDSLMYEIETEDFYKDISGDVEKRFDTSDYPENHPSGIPTGINKKVLGMFKDEAAGKVIKEFVGLRAKMYSFILDEGEETKKCKGVKKQVIESFITHDDYKKCLENGKEQLRKQNILRSYNHEVFTEEVNKIALSAKDDKRHILDDGKHTLALGHYKAL